MPLILVTVNVKLTAPDGAPVSGASVLFDLDRYKVDDGLMRAGFQIQTVNAVARNVRMQRVYAESDR